MDTNPVLAVALLWLVFGGLHIGLTTRRVRAALVARLGEHGFTAFFSVIASVSFAMVTWTSAADVLFRSSVTPAITSETTLVERLRPIPFTVSAASVAACVTVNPGNGSVPVVRPVSSMVTALAVPVFLPVTTRR